MAWLNTWKLKKLKKVLTNNSIADNDMAILLFKCIHDEYLLILYSTFLVLILSIYTIITRIVENIHNIICIEKSLTRTN